VFTNLRDGVYGGVLCWSGYGSYSFEQVETGGSGFDINNHVNTNLENQWDDIQRHTFAGSDVSLDMGNGALSAEFTWWVSQIGALASRSHWSKLIT